MEGDLARVNFYSPLVWLQVYKFVLRGCQDSFLRLLSLFGTVQGGLTVLEFNSAVNCRSIELHRKIVKERCTSAL